MPNARDERHRYGQHYTPREVARLLAAFAISSPGDLVLDPSCGDGRLLQEAVRFKQQLCKNRRSTKALSNQVFGVERSKSAVQAATSTGACISMADFFDVDPGAPIKSTVKSLTGAGQLSSTPSSLPVEFDAIIGNPPYIRQEVIGSLGKRRIEARLERDREACPEVFWPRWSGRSDIYVYFFAHSIRFLKKNGRLVFLTASSWLDAGYGEALREFLLRNFRVVAVIESATESFFTDASINTCITVLEREAEPRIREDNPIRFVRFNRALNYVLAGQYAEGAGVDAAVRLACVIRDEDTNSCDSYRVRSVTQSQLLNTAVSEQPTGTALVRGWGRYLRADDVFFKVIERGGSKLLNLSQMASVRFGVKTGANKFFYVREDDRSSHRDRSGLLELGDVASVRRGITTGANDFFYLSPIDPMIAQGSDPRGSSNGLIAVRDSAGKRRDIEPKLLSLVVFSLKEIPGILLERVEARHMLFNCALTRSELAGTRALEYIESGERAGYQRRPTCSNRDPWYSVARGMKPAPLIFPSKIGERWVVAVNRAQVFEDKKLYGVFPARGVSILLLAALLNSTWARYYAELTCRQMTGAQAIADIDVAVAEHIILSDPHTLSARTKKKLEAAVIELSKRPILSIFEEIKRADRRRLDSATLEAIGFREKVERELVLDQLYDAVTELVRARLIKSRGRNQ